MKHYLNKLPQDIRGIIHNISQAAVEERVSAYLVGGFVRDLILGEPNFDLDLTVDGDAIKLAQNLARKFQARIVIHKRFGTATLTFCHKKIDFATSRKECYPESACLPVVSPSSLKDDLARRDFSINAMAIEISNKNFGRLIDHFNGKEDLDNKKIRVLHNLSFIDDPTRILRAIRFEQRYGFNIEANTMALLKDAVNLSMLDVVEPQRIRDEIILLLKEKDPVPALKRLNSLAGLKFIHPCLKLKRAGFSLLRNVSRQIAEFSRNYPGLRRLDTWLIYFCALVDGLSLKNSEAVCRKFVFRKGEEKRIIAYKKIKRGLISKLCDKKIKFSGIYELLEAQSYEVVLMVRVRFANNVLNANVDHFFNRLSTTRIHTSGNDLHQLGLEPGPGYQKIFKQVLDAKLNNTVKNKQEELALIKQLIKKHGETK